MEIQRAIVTGQVLNLVTTKSMFTAQVDATTHELAENLWSAYLNSIYSEARVVLATSFTTTVKTLQWLNAGQWEDFVEEPYVYTGQASGDQMPNAVAAVLIATAEGVGRMGRKFFSGVSESFISGNSLYSTGITALASTLLAYITPVDDGINGVLTPGVVDKDGNFHAFVGGFVSSFLGSCRKRKPGVGI